MSDINWEAVAVATLHPTQVRILRELAEAGEALSPMQVTNRIGEGGDKAKSRLIGTVAHHFSQLASKGLIVRVRQSQVRGAVQTFYALTDLSVAGGGA